MTAVVVDVIEELVRRRPDWQDRAACRDLDSGIFFPVPGQSADQARAVCAGCGVTGRCLDYAVDSGLDFGIFGGLTPVERRRARASAQ